FRKFAAPYRLNVSTLYASTLQRCNVLTYFAIALKSYRRIRALRRNCAYSGESDEHQRTRLTPMKTLRRIRFYSIHACAVMMVATSIQAQQVQVTGTPGTPGATTTISGKQLPPPDPKFGGVIKDDALQSKA